MQAQTQILTKKITLFSLKAFLIRCSTNSISRSPVKLRNKDYNTHSVNHLYIEDIEYYYETHRENKEWKSVNISGEIRRVCLICLKGTVHRENKIRILKI